MPHLNYKGPEEKGSRTGRKLGKCKDKEKSEYVLGEGMGKKRKSTKSCKGKGKRIKSGKLFNNDKYQKDEKNCSSYKE